MIKAIDSIKDKVFYLLTHYPGLRDNDKKLISNIWHIECGDSRRITGYALLDMYSNDKLSNTEAIRRSRQLIQQKNPSLRGKLYNQRHGLREEVRTEIHNVDIDETDVNQTKMKL